MPCRKFFQSGICVFEGNCKYTHYTPEQLCILRQQGAVHLLFNYQVDCINFTVEQLELKRQKKEEERNNIPSLESWLEKYDQMVNKDDGETLQTPWSYSESLALRQDLPPSMIRFKPEHFSDDNFEEWGG